MIINELLRGGGAWESESNAVLILRKLLILLGAGSAQNSASAVSLYKIVYSRMA